MQATIYNQIGEAAGTIELPEAVFGLPWNADLVHQVFVAQQANARTPVAHAKDRGEVSGGGKKPWRQKGTGRARHGSIRSPIWRGGGATFGPLKDRVFGKKVNKKMAAKAFATVLSRKHNDGELVFVDALEADGKTRTTLQAVAKLLAANGSQTLRKQNIACILVPERDEALERSVRNLGNIRVKQVRDANVLDLLRFTNVVFVQPEASIAMISERLNRRLAAKAA